MKPYAIIEVPDNIVQLVSTEIYEYVKKYTNHLETGVLGWQFLNTLELLSKCPTLVIFFRKHKLLVKGSAITICVDDTQLPMHIDESPVVAKINFPVAFTKGWSNRWYYISDQQLNSCPRILNQFNEEIVDLSSIGNADVIAEIKDMHQPIVFNSIIPHSVNRIAEDIEGPRIVASFTFYNEPLSWLE